MTLSQRFMKSLLSGASLEYALELARGRQLDDHAAYGFADGSILPVAVVDHILAPKFLRYEADA